MIVSAIYGPDGKTIAVTLDDGTVLWVPDDMANRHRVELEEWVAAGNQIAPYGTPSSKPAPRRAAAKRKS